MPELPEVETIRRDLDERSSASGSRPSRSPAPARSGGSTKKQFVARLEGAKITGVERKGKYLLLKLDTGDLLVIHLRMSGQLLRAAAKEPVVEAHPRGAHLHPGRPAALRRPPHVRRDVRQRPSELAEEVPSWPTWASTRSTSRSRGPSSASCCSRSRCKLKALLMDQSLIAGIGNIYSDEILCAAGLRYDRMSDSAVDAGDPAAVPGRGRDAARGRQAPRLDPRRRAVRRPLRRAGRLPGTSTRCTTARARPAAGAGHDRTAKFQGRLDLLLPQLPGLNVVDRRPLRILRLRQLRSTNRATRTGGACAASLEPWTPPQPCTWPRQVLR